MSGSYLNSNDEVYEIIKTPPKINTPKALQDWKQKIFVELYGLSGRDYQVKLNEAKTHWARKVKLTNDQAI